MGDTENSENVLPPSKKRAAGRELSRDNPGLDDEEEDASEQATGTFKRASDEVLASRRIVRVRRNPNPIPSAPSSNPFASIRLVPPPTDSGSTESKISTEFEGKNGMARENDESSDVAEEKTTDVVKEQPGAANELSNLELVREEITNVADKAKTDVEEQEVESVKPDTVNDAGNPELVSDEKEVENAVKKENRNEARLSSFRQLSSSQNAFTGLAGTGFSSSTFSFGLVSRDSTLFGPKNDLSPSGLGLSVNGSSSLFPTKEATGFPPMQEISVETGEENEKSVFTADSVLFEFLDGGWKERGKGELKVKVNSETEKARLVMRARGNYRLVLNASLYPDMKLTKMEKKGITFACMNSIGEGKEGLSTFALKFKDGSIVEEFQEAVAAHKGKAGTALKTPENSPKALVED